MADARPTFDELVDRIEALERKQITVRDLPFQGMIDRLEQDWRPNSQQIILPRSVGAPALAAVPYCKLQQSTAFSVQNGVVTTIGTTDNGTGVVATNPKYGFDTEFDINTPGGMHSGTVNIGRVTAQIPGFYGYHLYAVWDGNGVGSRYVSVTINGGGAVGADRRPAAAVPAESNVSGFYPLSANDYFEIAVYQDSGANRNCSLFFEAIWLGNIS